MSSKRPGTVDYSKWDAFEDSGEEGEEQDEEEEHRCIYDNHYNDGDESSREDESSYSSESSDKEIITYQRPVARRSEFLSLQHVGLTTLQQYWNTDLGTITRPCSNCFRPNASCRCSRCQLARYCNVNCQRMYHHIHRLECIDARKHASYWGVFDKKDDMREELSKDDNVFKELRSRRNSKRRRVMQKTAAKEAVERARRARMAQGVPAKGGGKGKGADEREEECSICQSEFTVHGDGGVAFCCPTSHYMCNECAGVFVNSVMCDLEASYPPKCHMCKALISQDLFVRQLTSSQQNTFRTHVARTALKEGEMLVECKECGLFEVVTNDPVLWWCPHCSCGTCRVCNKDLPKGVNKYDINQSPHKLCSELREPKRMIEQAIEEGSNMRCPGCNLAGRKDDACTHMTCTKCSTLWCYVCGLDVKSCDKARPEEGKEENDIYLHNRDWEVNEKRCPMYLTQILEVDLHWLGENWEENANNEDFEDDEKCLDYLHRFRTIKLLQGVLQEIGRRSFINAFVTFDSIKNCGYTFAEVVSTSTDHLIDRGDYLENGRLEYAEGRNDPWVEGNILNVAELEQQIIEEALHRSVESSVEDTLLLETLTRSAEE